MNMTYDGVLVMPNNYVVMDQEEMTYVDGGIAVNNRSCNSWGCYSSGRSVLWGRYSSW